MTTKNNKTRPQKPKKNKCVPIIMCVLVKHNHTACDVRIKTSNNNSQTK